MTISNSHLFRLCVLPEAREEVLRAWEASRQLGTMVHVAHPPVHYGIGNNWGIGRLNINSRNMDVHTMVVYPDGKIRYGELEEHHGEVVWMNYQAGIPSDAVVEFGSGDSRMIFLNGRMVDNSSLPPLPPILTEGDKKRLSPRYETPREWNHDGFRHLAPCWREVVREAIGHFHEEDMYITQQGEVWFPHRQAIGVSPPRDSVHVFFRDECRYIVEKNSGWVWDGRNTISYRVGKTVTLRVRGRYLPHGGEVLVEQKILALRQFRNWFKNKLLICHVMDEGEKTTTYFYNGVEVTERINEQFGEKTTFTDEELFVITLLMSGE